MYSTNPVDRGKSSEMRQQRAFELPFKFKPAGIIFKKVVMLYGWNAGLLKKVMFCIRFAYRVLQNSVIGMTKKEESQ